MVQTWFTNLKNHSKEEFTNCVKLAFSPGRLRYEKGETKIYGFLEFTRENGKRYDQRRKLIIYHTPFCPNDFRIRIITSLTWFLAENFVDSHEKRRTTNKRMVNELTFEHVFKLRGKTSSN